MNSTQSDLDASKQHILDESIYKSAETKKLFDTIVDQVIKIREIKTDTQHRIDPDVDGSGVAHLKYSATPDSNFILGKNSIYLADELKCSSDEFHEICSGFIVPDSKDTLFFFECTTPLPKWLRKLAFSEWGWTSAHLHLKNSKR